MKIIKKRKGYIVIAISVVILTITFLTFQKYNSTYKNSYWSTYKSKLGGISLDYPTGWTVFEKEDKYGYDPTHEIYITITPPDELEIDDGKGSLNIYAIRIANRTRHDFPKVEMDPPITKALNELHNQLVRVSSSTNPDFEIWQDIKLNSVYVAEFIGPKQNGRIEIGNCHLVREEVCVSMFKHMVGSIRSTE